MSKALKRWVASHQELFAESQHCPFPAWRKDWGLLSKWLGHHLIFFKITHINGTQLIMSVRTLPNSSYKHTHINGLNIKHFLAYAAKKSKGSMGLGDPHPLCPRAACFLGCSWPATGGLHACVCMYLQAHTLCLRDNWNWGHKQASCYHWRSILIFAMVFVTYSAAM